MDTPEDGRPEAAVSLFAFFMLAMILIAAVFTFLALTGRMSYAG